MRISTGLWVFPNSYSFTREEMEGGNLNVYSSIKGNDLVITPGIFLSMRFEWLRLSFTKVGIPWFPTLYSMSAEKKISNIEGSIQFSLLSNDIVLSYLPAESLEFKGDIFLGLPGKLQTHLSLFLSFISFQVREMFGLSSLPMVGIGGGASGKNWEVFLLFQAFPLSQGWKEIIPGFSPALVEENVTESFQMKALNQWNFPLIILSGSYFFFPFFGIQVKGGFLDTQFLIYSCEDIQTAPSIYENVHLSLPIFSVEAIYRFQFGL